MRSPRRSPSSRRPQLLQTDKADVHTELKSAEITNLPLNQFRNYQALVVLVPGSLPRRSECRNRHAAAVAQHDRERAGRGREHHAHRRHARTSTSGCRITTCTSRPPRRSTRVTMTTGSMDAEQGMAAGAAITVTTKSGTNIFKGSAFEFFNNQKLNAEPVLLRPRGGAREAAGRAAHVGGTLGGPIVRNRLFFFGSYEGYLSRRDQYTFYSVPDAALRNGDFSNALNTNGTLQRIYDPLTGDLATGNGRVQFDNNLIPAGRIDPIAAKLLQMYPMPNVEGTGAGGLTNNYRDPAARTTDRHNFDVKVNWNRTRAHQFWGKFSHMHAVVDDLFTFPIGESDDDGGRDEGLSDHRRADVVARPDAAARQLVRRLDRRSVRAARPTSTWATSGLDLGIPGTNDQGRGDPRYAGLPNFATGFTALGNTPTWSPIYMDRGRLSFRTNLTKVAGKHDIKAGYFAEPDDAGPLAAWNGRTRAAASLCDERDADVRDRRADGELLQPVRRVPARPGRHRAARAIQYQLFTTREWQHALFVRDRWTPSPKLTLDLGRALGVLPDHAPRRSASIEMLDLRHARRVARRRGRQPEEHGARRAEGRLRAAGRRGVPPQRKDGRCGAGYGADLRRAGMWRRRLRAPSYPLALNSSFQPPAAGATSAGTARSTRASRCSPGPT